MIIIIIIIFSLGTEWILSVNSNFIKFQLHKPVANTITTQQQQQKLDEKVKNKYFVHFKSKLILMSLDFYFSPTPPIWTAFFLLFQFSSFLIASLLFHFYWTLFCFLLLCEFGFMCWRLIQLACVTVLLHREGEREEPSAASTTKTKPKISTAKFYEANERALCVHSSMTRPMKYRINGMVWFSRWKNEYQTRETFASWPFAFLFSLLAQFFHW